MNTAVEVQPNTDPHAFAHPHMSGDVLAVHDIEALQRMCPMMGRLSVEQVGEFLEMQAKRQERLATPSETTAIVTEVPSAVVEPAKRPPVESIATERLHALHTFEDDPVHEQNIRSAINTLKISETGVTSEQSPTPTPAHIETRLDEPPRLVRVSKESVKPVESHSSAVPNIPEAYAVAPIIVEAAAADDELRITEQTESTFQADKLNTIDAVLEAPAIDMISNKAVAEFVHEETLEIQTLPAVIEPITLSLELDNKVNSPEATPLPMSTEEVEAVVDMITDTLESEDTVAEPIKIILTQIHELVEESRAFSEDTMIERTEELESLIITLLIEVGVEPTPELTTSLIILLKEDRLKTVLRQPETRLLSVQLLSEKLGTNEFFSPIVGGLQLVQSTAAQMYAIGRSALHLYGAVTR